MSKGTSIRDFDAVLFDVDGTLIDSLALIVAGIGDTVERYAGFRPEATRIRSMIGLPLTVHFARYCMEIESRERLSEIADYAIERFEANRHLEVPYPEAVDALRVAHRAGKRTALVTSKSRPEVEHFLTRFPAVEHVDTVVCASDVALPKPDPASVALACTRLGVAPTRAVMIGDSIFDLQCARSAGAASIAVGYGAGDPADLRAELPDLYLSTPAELLEWALTANEKHHAPQEVNV